MADVLTPWYSFGDGYQQGRYDNNVNAEILKAGHGWDWRVSRLTAQGAVSLAIGSTPVGMTDAEALDKAMSDASKALLEAR